MARGRRAEWPVAKLALRVAPVRGPFYAGGRIDAGGAEIGRLLLTFEDGSQLEDDGVGAVSLFISHHGEPPTSVEIFAPDGALLSKRLAF